MKDVAPLEVKDKGKEEAGRPNSASSDVEEAVKKAVVVNGIAKDGCTEASDDDLGLALDSDADDQSHQNEIAADKENNEPGISPAIDTSSSAEAVSVDNKLDKLGDKSEVSLEQDEHLVDKSIKTSAHLAESSGEQDDSVSQSSEVSSIGGVESNAGVESSAQQDNEKNEEEISVNSQAEEMNSDEPELDPEKMSQDSTDTSQDSTDRDRDKSSADSGDKEKEFSPEDKNMELESPSSESPLENCDEAMEIAEDALVDVEMAVNISKQLEDTPPDSSETPMDIEEPVEDDASGGSTEEMNNDTLAGIEDIPEDSVVSEKSTDAMKETMANIKIEKVCEMVCVMGEMSVETTDNVKETKADIKVEPLEGEKTVATEHIKVERVETEKPADTTHKVKDEPVDADKVKDEPVDADKVKDEPVDDDASTQCRCIISAEQANEQEAVPDTAVEPEVMSVTKEPEADLEEPVVSSMTSADDRKEPEADLDTAEEPVVNSVSSADDVKESEADSDTAEEPEVTSVTSADDGKEPEADHDTAEEPVVMSVSSADDAKEPEADLDTAEEPVVTPDDASRSVSQVKRVVESELIDLEPDDEDPVELVGDKQAEPVLLKEQERKAVPMEAESLVLKEQERKAVPTEAESTTEPVQSTLDPETSAVKEPESMLLDDDKEAEAESAVANETSETAMEETAIEPDSSEDVEMIDVSSQSSTDLPKTPIEDDNSNSSMSNSATESVRVETESVPTTPKTKEADSGADQIKDILRTSLLAGNREGFGTTGKVAEPALTNGVAGRKRLTEMRTSALEIKKARLSGPLSSKRKENVRHNGSGDKAVNGDGPAPPAKKVESNLDRAIARVASGGKKKRQREISEILKQIDNKMPTALTEGDVEEVMLHMLLEAITQRSDVGHLRDMISTLSTSVKKWRGISTNLAKQVRDMQLVVKRMAADTKTTGQPSAPIKVTRSVGLQVGSQPGQVHPNVAAPAAAAPKANPPRPTPPPTRRAPGGGIITNRSTPAAPQAQPTATPPKQLMAPATRVPGPGVSVLSESLLKSPLNKVTTAIPPSLTRLGQPQTVRPPQLRPAGRQVSGCIDLTDEDDRPKSNGSAVPMPNQVRIVNQMSASKQGNSIRLVSPSQLSASSASNGPPSRVTYTVVAPSTAPGGGATKSVFFTTSPTQQPGVSLINRAAVPRLGAKPMNTAAAGSSQPAAVPRPLQSGPRPPKLVQIPNSALRRVGPPGTTPPRGMLRPVATPPNSSLHPAPLPPAPPFFMPSDSTTWRLPPPQPDLKISKCDNRQQGIILSWKMDSFSDRHEAIANYQLYAYQETNSPPNTASWKRVGEVKSMALPMACTLTQFSVGNTYHFAVRALDVKGRTGPFSAPGSILLPKE